MFPKRIRPAVALVVVCVTGAAVLAACGGSGSTSTTTSSVGGGSAGASSTSTTSSSTTTTAAGSAAGGCPQGTYVLQDPGSGLPFQIATGGTGTVITIDGDDNATISFDDYATASGSTTGGSFTIDAQGVITARVVETATPGEFELADVDATGITGQQTITLDSGESFTIEGADFTQLAQGLAPYGPGAVLSCSPAGDLQASAGPITQTYERQSG